MKPKPFCEAPKTKPEQLTTNRWKKPGGRTTQVKDRPKDSYLAKFTTDQLNLSRNVIKIKGYCRLNDNFYIINLKEEEEAAEQILCEDLSRLRILEYDEEKLDVCLEAQD